MLVGPSMLVGSVGLVGHAGREAASAACANQAAADLAI
jgi:hypothetical protein